MGEDLAMMDEIMQVLKRNTILSVPLRKIAKNIVNTALSFPDNEKSLENLLVSFLYTSGLIDRLSNVEKVSRMVLLLREGTSAREISSKVSLSQPMVLYYLRRFKRLGFLEKVGNRYVLSFETFSQYFKVYRAVVLDSVLSSSEVIAEHIDKLL